MEAMDCKDAAVAFFILAYLASAGLSPIILVETAPRSCRSDRSGFKVGRLGQPAGENEEETTDQRGKPNRSFKIYLSNSIQGHRLQKAQTMTFFI